MADWLSLPMLRGEIIQRKEEGCSVADLESWLSGLGDNPSGADLIQGWAEAESRAPLSGFPYEEPTDLRSILALRPEGPRRLSFSLSADELYDRVYGAWLGRSAGCLLGKPVEGWSRESIQKLLQAAGEWPLSDYFPYLESGALGADYSNRPKNWFRGQITGMVRDDDMDYPVLGLKLLEKKGLAFTSADTADNWLASLPYMLVYTAERVAYRNLVGGLKPPASGAYRNPYREWIGAQIRADIWGYVAPGNPQLAAELAHRDAVVSHTKNGVYGEMLFAAMISASFALTDPKEIISVGLSEIPERSRLAEAVRNVVRWCEEERDWEKTLDRIYAEYGHYNWIHTINNAAFVIMGLLYSGGELEPAICRTVACGMDTDCTGATVGSIIGAMKGARALPGKWIAPLGDRLASIVVDYTDSSISDLARRTIRASDR